MKKEIIFAYERMYEDEYGKIHFLPNGELRYLQMSGFTFEAQFDFLQLTDILEYEGFVIKRMRVEDAIRTGRKFIIPIEGIADPQYWLGLKNSKYGRELFSFFKKSTIKTIQNGQANVLLYCREGICGCSYEELILNIYNNCDKYKVPRESVYYVSGDLSLESKYSDYVSGYRRKVKFYPVPHFLYLTRAMYSRSKDNPDFLPQISDLDKLDRKYNFLCLNKLPRSHRYFFVFQLWNMFKSNSLISMPTDKINPDLEYVLGVSDWRDDLDNLYENFEHVLGYGVSELNEMERKFKENLPLTLDVYNDPEKIKFEIANFSYVSNSWVYNNSYFSVVTETTAYGPQVFITEKTFKTFPSLHPCIVFGCPQTMKYLKKLGFKTFSPYINEDYDEERNVVKKMKMIFDEINRLCSSSELLQKTFTNLKEILIYNYNHFWNHDCPLNKIIEEMVSNGPS